MSSACCSIPPVVPAKEYQAKGFYDAFATTRVYITGSEDATKAILFIFDIFGFYPQTLQGADMLANSGETKYRVMMPDWFDGCPAHIGWYPPTMKDQKENLEAFFDRNSPSSILPRLFDVQRAAQRKYPTIETWGIVGLCWGAKVATLACARPDSRLLVAAQCHPAMIDPADAKAVKVPMCLLTSKDEDAEAVAEFDRHLDVPKHVETFADQQHGWMGARAELEKEDARKEFARGYKILVEFFNRHL